MSHGRELAGGRPVPFHTRIDAWKRIGEQGGIPVQASYPQIVQLLQGQHGGRKLYGGGRIEISAWRNPVKIVGEAGRLPLIAVYPGKNYL